MQGERLSRSVLKFLTKNAIGRGRGRGKGGNRELEGQGGGDNSEVYNGKRNFFLPANCDERIRLVEGKQG